MQVDNNQTNSISTVFYLDKNNQIKTDENKSSIGYIGKIITSKLGYRNYEILDVLKVAATSSIDSLDDYKIKLICEKASKKLHLDSNQVTGLFQLMRHAQQGNIDESKLHTLTKELANSKTLKSLQKLNEHFEKGSSAGNLLSSVINEATVKSRWGALNLDPKLVDTHFEEVQFLIKTRLIYSIIGYQNTTAAGPLEHAIKEEIDPQTGESHLWIKKQNEWVTVKQVKEEFSWDDFETALTSKTNKHERWNYFDEGLVPVDRFYHHDVAHEENYPQQNKTLHPIKHLTEDEMQALLTRAKEFTGFNGENNPSKTKEELTCVVQFVSHPRPKFEKEWQQNANAQVPVHCGIRLVMSDGTVYSTGFGSALQEDVYNEGLSKYLGTINGQPTIMDYEEFRPHEGRIVTNVPIGEARAENILKHLNAYREQTIRFNVFKQNCMNLGAKVLSMAGTDLDITQTFKSTLYRALPDLESIPGIGKPLKSLQGRVKQISDAVGSKIPTVVKKAFSLLESVVFFVPNKFGLLMRNLLVRGMGGLVASPIREGKQPSTEEKDQFEPMKSYEKLLNGLMDEKASDIQHSAVFINWQLQQASTDIHRYTGQPNINILPTQTPEEEAYSEKRKGEFRKIYKYATPMNSAPESTAQENQAAQAA